MIDPDDSQTLEELLHQDNSLIELRNDFNYTFLHWAAVFNRTSCIRVMLRFAPHLIEVTDVYNRTALMLAVLFDKRDVAKMLMKAGIDVWAKDEQDHTVFDLARRNGHKEMLEILNQHQQVSGIL